MVSHCIESKLYLNTSQRKKIDYWLRLQNWIWNRGLALIEWREWWERWSLVLNSIDNVDGLEPVPLRYHPNNLSILEKRTRKGIKTKSITEWGLCCDRVGWRKYNPQNPEKPELGEWREEIQDGKFLVAFPDRQQVKGHWLEYPILPGLDNEKVRSNPYFDLVSCFAKRDVGDKLSDCPSAFIKGTCKTLADSWKAYKKGIRNRPKYKNARHCIDTLIHPNSKGTKLKGHYVSIPNLGYVRSSKSLENRWNGLDYCPMKICRKASGYYLQITFDVDAKQSKHYNGRVVGIDAGVKALVFDDKGHSIEPVDVSRLQYQINVLQQKASKSYELNRNNPNWKRRNLRRLYQKIGKLHERIARKRLGHAHFVADRIVQSADVIVLEDLSHNNMRKKAKGKLNDEGHFEHNNASAKSGLNKSLATVSMGQLQALIKSKADEREKLWISIPPKHTSGICSNCGHNHYDAKQDKNLWRPTQEQFICQSCGIEINADLNAARNIKQVGLELLRDYSEVEIREMRKGRKTSTSKGSTPQAEKLSAIQARQGI